MDEGIEGWTDGWMDGRPDRHILYNIIVYSCNMFSVCFLLWHSSMEEKHGYIKCLPCVNSMQAGVSIFSHSEVSV